MLAEERFSLIMEQLDRKRTVTVQELCEALNTSESTIRRDLTELDRLGKLNKVHGGATLPDSRFLADEPTMEAKEDAGCGAEAQHRAGGGRAHQRRMILCSSMQAPPRWSWCVHWRGMPSKPAM
ncbi:MAG: DeoR family transcriptional regulator [Faecalibacterium prausnitzii]